MLIDAEGVAAALDDLAESVQVLRTAAMDCEWVEARQALTAHERATARLLLALPTRPT